MDFGRQPVGIFGGAWMRMLTSRYPHDNRPATASGLMLRESLAEPCSRYVLVQVEASGNLVCRWREKSGDQDGGKKKELGKATLPIHLRLVQTGREIQIFTSADGQNWGESLMSHTTAFDEKGRAGLFVCSGNPMSSTTTEFESVKISRFVGAPLRPVQK